MSTPYNPKNTGSMVRTPGSGRLPELDQSNQSRMLPRQVSTGAMRGTQLVGALGAKIDSSNNRIVLSAPDGSGAGIGAIPGSANEVGLFTLNPQGVVTYKVVNGVSYYYDDNGNLLLEIRNGTLFFHDKTTEINYMTLGILPNGVTGLAGANTGFSVEDGF